MTKLQQDQSRFILKHISVFFITAEQIIISHVNKKCSRFMLMPDTVEETPH